MESDDAGPFLFFISKRFFEIRNNFKIKILHLGFCFDEDIFSETLLKCNEALSKYSLNNDNMLFYFWRAFKNNTLRDLTYSRNKLRSEFPIDVIEKVEVNIIDEYFEKISRQIIQNFGYEAYNSLILHTNGMPYETLCNITNINNLKYRFRRIREYIRQRLPKT